MGRKLNFEEKKNKTKIITQIKS